MQRNYRFRPRFVAGYGAAPPPPPVPVLSSPFALPFGDTSGYIGVVTDTGNGTLYYVVTTSATPPSQAQVKAGQTNTGSAAPYAGSQAVASAGAKNATATGLSSNTLYYPYFMHENSTGGQSDVKGLTSFTTLTTGTSDTSWDNLIAAMTTPPTNFRAGLIAQCIQSLYAAGVWSKIDVMWICAAATEQAGQLNWINPGSDTLTLVNSPTFTADRGFAGNGSTSYIDTGFDPSTDAVQYTQNNASISVYQRTGGSNGNEPFGSSISGAPPIRVAGGTGTSTRANVNSSTQINGPAGGTQPLLGMGRRNDASNVSVLRDGVEVTAPTSAASSAIPAGNMYLLRRGSGTYVTHQVAAAHMGAYLNDAEALAFYNAQHVYMVAIGADT